MIVNEIICITPINTNIMEDMRFDHLINSIGFAIKKIIYLFNDYLLYFIKVYFLPYHQHFY